MTAETDIAAIDDGGANTAAEVRTALTSVLERAATMAYKTADETVTSSTTLQDDDHLVLAIGANEVWTTHLYLFATCAVANIDLRMGFTVPTGASGQWGFQGLEITTTSVEGNLRAQGIPFTGGTSVQPAGVAPSSSGDSTVHVWTYVANGANAGNVQFQWAQWVSNGDGVTVKEGSHMIAHQLA